MMRVRVGAAYCCVTWLLGTWLVGWCAPVPFGLLVCLVYGYLVPAVWACLWLCFWRLVVLLPFAGGLLFIVLICYGGAFAFAA